MPTHTATITTSATQHAAPQRRVMRAPSTIDTLARARAAIHRAVAAHDDPQLRRAHARAARNYAAIVIAAADSTAYQRRYAGYYLDDADGILGGAT
ncbi:hypothetical protein EB74_08665 [Mycobacterium sp. SWH-M5]|nr:hypothetical protein EB74_08665 [Mycobacterium sp. SWH-M5]